MSHCPQLKNKESLLYASLKSIKAISDRCPFNERAKITQLG